MRRSLLSTFVLLRKHSPAPPTNDVNDGVSGAGIPLKNRCERSVSFVSIKAVIPYLMNPDSAVR